MPTTHSGESTPSPSPWASPAKPARPEAPEDVEGEAKSTPAPKASPSPSPSKPARPEEPKAEEEDIDGEAKSCPAATKSCAAEPKSEAQAELIATLCKIAPSISSDEAWGFLEHNLWDVDSAFVTFLDTKGFVATQNMERPPARYANPNVIEFPVGPPPRFTLCVYAKLELEERFQLYPGEKYVFGGHAACDFVIRDPTVSPFHACLRINRRGKPKLHNLVGIEVGHNEGTITIDGQRMTETMEGLDLGACFRLGKHARFYIVQETSIWRRADTTRRLILAGDTRDEDSEDV